MKLSAARKKYKGQWMAFRYKDQTKTAGDVLVHHKNRHEFHKKVIALDVQSVAYLTFNGPVVPKGFTLAL